jgi:hypothetical protein
VSALAERAEARRLRALELLAELRVLERLSKLGPVEITGSVAHGLVVAHDIDVDVTVAALDARACFAVIGELAADPRVVRVVYTNATERFGWLSFDIVCVFGGEKWTIELYVNGPEASCLGWTAELAGVFSRVLSPEQRDAILELKEALVDDPEYRSMDVYRAVMDGGVSGVDAFLAWRTEHGSEELARWLPATVPPG